MLTNQTISGRIDQFVGAYKIVDDDGYCIDRHMLTSQSFLKRLDKYGRWYAMRLVMRFEADLAGGKEGEYASETRPHLHMWLSDELSLVDVDDPNDDGVIVVPYDMLRDEREFEVFMPISPSHIARSMTDEHRRWPLPGAAELLQMPTGPDAQGRWRLPADTYVVSEVGVRTATENGSICESRAGNTFHLLSELLNPNMYNVDEGGISLPAIQTTGDSPLIKGFLRVVEPAAMVAVNRAGRVTPLQWQKYIVFDAPIDGVTVFHGDESDTRVAAEAESMLEQLARHASDAMRIFIDRAGLLHTSDPSYMSMLHCPYYLTAGGMLDGSMYALNAPRRPPSWRLYDRMLELVLLQNDCLAQHLMLAVDAQRRDRTRLLPSMRIVDGKIFGEMFTVLANAFPYENDFVNDGGRTLVVTVPDKRKRNNVVLRHAAKAEVIISEDYKIARLYHADDCEGVGLEIDMEYDQLRRVDFTKVAEPDGDVEAAARLTLLRHYQQLILDCVYVDVLPLACVTNKSLDHEKRELDPKNVLAHTFSSLVPTAVFLDRLDAHDADMAARVRSSRHVTRYLKSARAYDRDRDVLILEGTARSSAFQSPAAHIYGADAKDALRRVATRIEAQETIMRALGRDLASHVGFEVLQHRIDDPQRRFETDKEGISDFYQTMSALYTRTFADAGILDFAFARVHPDTGAITHGLHVNKFAAVASMRTNDWRFVPYNRIDAKEGARAQRIFSRLEPVPAITVDESIEEPRVDAFRRMVLKSDVVGDDEHASAILLNDPSAMIPPPLSVVFSVRHDELNESTLADAIVNAIGTDRHRRRVSVTTRVLANPPVHGDDLPPVIVHYVEVRL